MTSAQSLSLAITYDDPDEDGWIVARVHQIPAAISEGRTRAEARKNVVDVLRLVLMPDAEEMVHSGGRSEVLDLDLRR